MKVAYLFHGHMRTWKDCYKSFFDNVYSTAPGDIYIHTWNRTNSQFGSHWNVYHRRLTNEMERRSAEIVDIDYLSRIYKTKNILVEDDPGLDLILQDIPQISELINYLPSHLAIYNMFNSQYKSFKLAKDTGITYDRYFSCRPDLFFPNKLDIQELHEENCLACPYIAPGHSVFDIYAFGTENVMSVRANFYKYMWEFWYSKVTSGPLRWHTNYDFSVEEAVTEYLLSHNIRLYPSKLQYNIRRMF